MPANDPSRRITNDPVDKNLGLQLAIIFRKLPEQCRRLLSEAPDCQEPLFLTYKLPCLIVFDYHVRRFAPPGIVDELIASVIETTNGGAQRAMRVAAFLVWLVA